jgi:hypothetical protein
MNDYTDSNRGSRRARFLICTVGIVLLMTACGASGGSPSSSTTTISAQTKKYQEVLTFSQCMRSHGVPEFPDPNPDGSISLSGTAREIKFSSSQVESAIQTCRRELPNGGTLNPAQLQTALTVLLKFSQCMRAHGVPNFPDPAMVNGNITLNLQGTGFSTSSPQDVTAAEMCESVLRPKGTGTS